MSVLNKVEEETCNLVKVKIKQGLTANMKIKDCPCFTARRSLDSTRRSFSQLLAIKMGSREKTNRLNHSERYSTTQKVAQPLRKDGKKGGPRVFVALSRKKRTVDRSESCVVEGNGSASSNPRRSGKTSMSFTTAASLGHSVPPDGPNQMGNPSYSGGCPPGVLGETIQVRVLLGDQSDHVSFP